MVDTFFIMDLCFNFIRPTDTGNRARKLARIRQNYMAFWFWVDLISSIPYVGPQPQPPPSLANDQPDLIPHRHAHHYPT